MLLYRQEKNVFATLHLKGNEARFLHSSSLGSQGSSGPAFVGDTKVVAQKKVDSLKTMGEWATSETYWAYAQYVPYSTGN